MEQERNEAIEASERAQNDVDTMHQELIIGTDVSPIADGTIYWFYS